MDLVDRIRSSENYVPELSFVAESDGKIVGHTMLSYVDLVGDAVSPPGPDVVAGIRRARRAGTRNRRLARQDSHHGGG